MKKAIGPRHTPAEGCRLSAIQDLFSPIFQHTFISMWDYSGICITALLMSSHNQPNQRNEASKYGQEASCTTLRLISLKSKSRLLPVSGDRISDLTPVVLRKGSEDPFAYALLAVKPISLTTCIFDSIKDYFLTIPRAIITDGYLQNANSYRQSGKNFYCMKYS